MELIIEHKIKQLLAQRDLNIRNSQYRYMDQKITPDILSFIADCVLNFPEGQKSNFTKDDLWDSDYFSKNTDMIFNKPKTHDERAKHEYDKFTAQPLKTLAFAGVLKEWREGRANHYSINEVGVLEYIALGSRNAFRFLVVYLEAVFRRSGFWQHIEAYENGYAKNPQTSKTNYAQLKKAFEKFTLGNTKIRGKTEIHRIFPKAFNPLAVSKRLPGSRKGRVTKEPYLYADLMYNDTNFRDLGKSKWMSRREYAEQKSRQEQFGEYEMQKAKGFVRKQHAPDSEVKDALAKGEATQVHHIFPSHSHTNLRSTLENLVLLTPQQHYTKAHPNNNTQQVDPDYQIVCLLAKVESVRNSEMNQDGVYSKEGLINVINEGLSLKLNSRLSFEEITNRLRQYQLEMH